MARSERSGRRRKGRKRDAHLPEQLLSLQRAVRKAPIPVDRFHSTKKGAKGYDRNRAKREFRNHVW